MERDCTTCKYSLTKAFEEPCYSCSRAPYWDKYEGEANSCVDCKKKDAEILELRLQLANEQTGNAELKAKLAAETKRADVAEERANKLSRNSHVGQREVFHELKSRLKL